ncbi:uncharacterized protein LOC105437304 [Strongylocentrotus purpuratus]|uniref:Ig-like domain-containing protein n=1 Tax=Strongylocentrotus purpuratus TaxID=7668 RepID=A0A7M7NG97_STRPU|nr:uncharacterized protein LOC105437304 [Strongylocentrotus purpuratus]
MATSSIQLVFVGVILIILWTESVTNGEVPDGVVYTDLHKTVQKDAEVVLTCQFYGTPIAVYWKKGDDPTTSPNLITWVEGEPLTGSCVPDGACKMGDDYSLTIKKAEIRDQGRYICRVSNYLGILIHNFTDVVIFAPPNEPYPVINECQEMALANPNDFCNITSHIPIEITCSVTNYFPDVDLFFLRGFQNVATSRTNELVNDDGTKNKSIVIEAEEGEWSYVCVASDIPGTLEHRTAKLVVINVKDDILTRSHSTVSSEREKDVQIVEIAAPPSLFLLFVAVLVFLVAILRRKKLARKSDVEKGEVGPPTRIEGNISFYELWSLIFGKDNDDRLENIRDTIRHLGISDVEDGLNAAQCYDVLCDWKDHHKQDSQAMDLKRALAKAGFDGAWKEIYDQRHRTDSQPSEDTLKHILWQVGDPDRIDKFLGDLIPGQRISVAGKMKDIVAEALRDLIQWCKGPPQHNPMVLLSLSLERTFCCPIDRDFFTGRNYFTFYIMYHISLSHSLEADRCGDKEMDLETQYTVSFAVPEGLLEEIGDYEVIGFIQRLAGKHCNKLAESIGTPTEALSAILVENDKATVFDTQGMIRDWISNEECSNFEKRHRLNVSVTKVCREDLEGYFGATDLYTSKEANEERARKDSNEVSREYGGISELETRRIANYLTDSELKHLGEGSDPVKVVIEWVNSLLEKNLNGGCRKRVHGTLKEIGLQALMPFQIKDKLCLVEVLDVAVRLLMTDIQPFAKALGISDQKLIKYRMDVTPKQLSNGTLALLAKDSNKINNDRSKISSSLSKADYDDLALLLKYGCAISLADMFALGYGPVPNSSQRDELRHNLGIATDDDDIVGMLKHWKSMAHPPTYNPRTTLADAVLPVLGKEKALSVLSGTSRQSGIHSEKVIRALREGILFRETCRVAEIINVLLPSVDDDPMTKLLITLEDQVKNDSLPEDVYEKLSVAGFKGLSTELKRGDCQENEHESTRMRRRDIIQNDISCRIAEVLGVKKTSSLSSIFEAWEEKLRKNPLKQDKRRDLSDRLLRAGYEDFAHEIMTGFVPRPLDQK